MRSFALVEGALDAYVWVGMERSRGVTAVVTGVSETWRAGKTFAGFALVVLAFGAAGLGAPAWAACEDPPKPRVDWRGCDKSGADLKGANLDSADLTSVNFSNADLSNAVLDYAVLQGATLQGAKLEGARMSRTLWNDGRICRRGSVGRCWVGGSGRGNQ